MGIGTSRICPRYDPKGRDDGHPTEEDSDTMKLNNPKGCSYKTIMCCRPRNVNGAEGTVGVVRWIVKMESVLDISN